MDRPEGTAPARMSPSCSALSSEGSGPGACPHSIWFGHPTGAVLPEQNCAS